MRDREREKITREAHLDWLCRLRSEIYVYMPKEWLIPMNNALDVAIKAIEQEPQSFKWCTDCKEYDQEKHCCHRWSKVIRDTVEELEKEPKAGHWIKYGIPRCGEQHYKCTNCDEYFNFGLYSDYYKKAFKYCPNCGCRMVEPQESEDNE